ncbi:hypothetical protein SUGI_1080140 [Cryptomeria japonica]|nr:hypothetical protein SUGI_1080140 [Cryptomeria japonica]
MAERGDEQQRNDMPATVSAQLILLNPKDESISWQDLISEGSRISNKFGKMVFEKLKEPRNVFHAAIEEGFFSA